MDKRVEQLLGDDDLANVVGHAEEAMREMCIKLGAYVYDKMIKHGISPWEFETYLDNDANWTLMKLWDRDESVNELRRDEKSYDENIDDDDVEEVDFDKMHDALKMGPKTEDDAKMTYYDDLVESLDEPNKVIEDLTPAQEHAAFEGAKKRHMLKTEISDDVVSEINEDRDLANESETKKQNQNEKALKDAALKDKDDDSESFDISDNQDF